MLSKLFLIDRYIIRQLIPPFIFALGICTTLAELIGISFEQVRFMVERDFPFALSVQVHLLKLPAFISFGLPIALLLATIITYSQLARKNEIIALQSCGVSLLGLIKPAIILSFAVAVIMFVFDQVVVPPANYQAAILIENQFKVDRNLLAKYQKKNFIYREFTSNQNPKNLKLLLVADRFDGQKMTGITLLQFTENNLQNIITANRALWDKKLKLWNLFEGSQSLIHSNGSYTKVNNFDKISLPLSQNILNYANNYRDNREMNIGQLYHRLNIVSHTNHEKKMRKLRISIQQRYALPFSCVVFTLLGAVLECDRAISPFHRDRNIKINSVTLIVIIVFIYQFSQFLTTALSTAGIIPVIGGVWFPNSLGLGFVGVVIFFNQRLVVLNK